MIFTDASSTKLTHSRECRWSHTFSKGLIDWNTNTALRSLIPKCYPYTILTERTYMKRYIIKKKRKKKKNCLIVCNFNLHTEYETKTMY